MLRLPKSLSKFVTGQRSLPLRQFHARSSRRSHPKSDDEDKILRRRENREARLHLYKSRGQHILTNPRVLDSIVRKSHIKPTDTVLEIGPGTGNLTLRLLEAAKYVVAVEIDKRMVEVLHKRVAERGLQDRLSVICNDALKTEFPQFDLVVANIPYGISSPLVAKLVYGANPFRSATLLLQKEFARRLLANPGDSEFNRLAVNVKLVADVEFSMDVSKRDFVPCPKVDSSVVIIRPKAEIPDVNLDEWWAFTRTCFGKKNKTLGATFKQKRKLLDLLKLFTKTCSSSESTASDHNYDHSNNSARATDDEGDTDETEYSSFCLDTRMSMFREKVLGVLNSGSFEDKRPSKLSNEELLHLLALFNQAGVYFHDHSKPRDADSVELAAVLSL
ncbi:hypothetical protein F2P56_019110 [Juglans regia]|uniref:rRNA adenine N(6)-methyltransferase n=2 Tax=Juglans regia TaxID=51240 RepID=A0A833XB26_JUGRE|nr:ribosomal RNA small subunit methyltransferase, mitochondrial [Juglans regia]KAF5463174.1 hypothetical protein F2P56_019110 [Juglans regia]